MATIVFGLLLQTELARLLAQTGWPARIVLLILLFFSVYSWAIIFRKHSTLKRAWDQTERFLEAFRSTERLPEPGPLASAFSASPLSHVYVAGMRVVARQVNSSNPHGGRLTNPDAVVAAARLASTHEMQRLEHRMGFLATTASVTPFIGLFGTVWGIIGAFMGLSQAGATTLSAVAPGIAEALVATAAGLFAAIPALVAYNLYLHQIRHFGTRMDNFTLEFVAKAESLYA